MVLSRGSPDRHLLRTKIYSQIAPSGPGPLETGKVFNTCLVGVGGQQGFENIGPDN